MKPTTIALGDGHAQTGQELEAQIAGAGAVRADVTLGERPRPAEPRAILTRRVRVLLGYGSAPELLVYERGTKFEIGDPLVAALPSAFEREDR